MTRWTLPSAGSDSASPLDVVIDWHRRGLVPLGPELTGDPRCTLIHGDFFALVEQKPPMIVGRPPTQFDAILLDVDHFPRHLLDDRHAPFYEPSALRQLGRHLRPDGVFALWSNDPPTTIFSTRFGPRSGLLPDTS